MFCIIFFFLNFTNSQRLSLLNGNITIFDDQHFLISKQFSIDNLKIKTCQSCSAFISNAAENYNEFVINNNNNHYVKFSYSVKSFDPNIVSVKHGSQNIQRKILLKPNQSWQFRVPYFCNPNNIGKQWTTIQINFTINNDENQIAYYKLCNKQQKAFHPYIFLIIFSTLSVLAGSFYGKNQINPFGQMHSETLGALTILIFVILSSLILISFLKFQNIGIYFITFVVMLIVFIATETLILDFQNNYDYSIKIKLIFSSFLSLMLIIAYFCTKNWIINNMQAISIILFSLKNIEIDCLKNGIILLIISASYETFWIFFSPNIFGTQILQTFGTQIELPIKLLCPSFNEQLASPITQCQVLGIGDVLLVGIVIKYIFKFEQTDGEQKIVFLFSLLGFVVGLLFYFISAHYYSIQWYPALYCLFPSTLVSIIIVSSCKKRFYQLWLGEVQPLFNGGTEVEQI